MSKTVNLGGDRLGSGNKMNVTMHGFERSNHDMGYLWKSTMAPGTLVPFYVKVALPGDVFDIQLDAQVRTHPTIGPLFGSYKLQLDLFKCPIRLYNSMLHNNMLNIGNDMSKVKLPLLTLQGEKYNIDSKIPLEFQNINQSSLLAYLGARGLPNTIQGDINELDINAIPYLAYFDIFKNFYANKQEENAYIIHGIEPTIDLAEADTDLRIDNLPHICNEWLIVYGTNLTRYNIQIEIGGVWFDALEKLDFWYSSIEFPDPDPELNYVAFKPKTIGDTIQAVRINPESNYSDIKPTLASFALQEIDDMRKDILMAPENSPFYINAARDDVYTKQVSLLTGSDNMFAIMAQEGLLVKTYQSDIFNNWISSETYDHITSITSISTALGSFTLDQLNLSKKVYDLLNRIVASGSTLEDWIEAAYDVSSRWRSEIPEYCGGLSKEIVFQEVVSTAATEGEPLGQLAGKGTMSSKHKGGDITIKIDEPSYVIGIVSITPRICYSQGNRWDIHLTTLDDLHKPSLDGIGFQDLITDNMATWSTQRQEAGITFTSAGKQPAWLNYMTEYDRSFGNFADPRSQMFMTLNRRYTPTIVNQIVIKDLTTYIDPSKFNYAFAQTDLSAQNFWVQIGIDDFSRRKMSQKIIPNL